MSSGVVVVAPHAVSAAAGAVPVLATAGAAVLIAVAVYAAMDVGVRVGAEYGEQLDRAAQAQSQRDVDAQIWPATVARVVELNARIRLFEQRVDRGGAKVVIPGQLSLAGCTSEQASQWCVRTADELARVQGALHDLVVERELARAGTELPVAMHPVARAKTVAALSRLREQLLSGGGTGTADLDAKVAEALRALDPDAYDGERAEALALAARVAKHAARPVEADGYLLNLTVEVNRLNKTVAGRRLAAQQLLVLENPIVVDTTPNPHSGTAEQLRRVVSGDEELTADLRAEARRAIEWADAVARRHYLEEIVRDCFADLGYEPMEDSGEQGSGTLEYGRPDWGAEYSAQITVDENGTIGGILLNKSADAGDEAAAADAEHCAAFIEDLEDVGERANSRVRLNGERVVQRTHANKRSDISGTNTGVGQAMHVKGES